jgi:hypothetical protein
MFRKKFKNQSKRYSRDPGIFCSNPLSAAGGDHNEITPFRLFARRVICCGRNSTQGADGLRNCRTARVN